MCQKAMEPDAASLHAAEHALVNALPLALLCDRRDVGSSSEQRRVYIYDFAEGGIGLSEKAFHLLEGLISSAATLLRECPCSEGCPSCMHLPGCPRGNGALDKVGGLALLEGHAVGGARATHALTSSDRPVQSTTVSVRSSSRRLRAIADEDRRQRYGLAPSWLEIGGLAQSAADGLVVVWALGRGMAQIQPLSGGESHWVSVSSLSPP